MLRTKCLHAAAVMRNCAVKVKAHDTSKEGLASYGEIAGAFSRNGGSMGKESHLSSMCSCSCTRKSANMTKCTGVEGMDKKVRGAFGLYVHG